MLFMHAAYVKSVASPHGMANGFGATRKKQR
jgi:hypothetical protein